MRSLSLVPVLLFLVATTLLGSAAAAQEATPMATPMAAPVEVLFVQSFTAGRLEPAAELGTATLTLQGPVGETIYFADHPNRGAGAVALKQFLAVLTQAAADPLNAALVIDRPEGDAVVVVELVEGTVDAAGTVTYNVRVLADSGELDTDMTQTAEPLPEITAVIDFGSSHLFVDGSCNLGNPDC